MVNSLMSRITPSKDSSEYIRKRGNDVNLSTEASAGPVHKTKHLVAIVTGFAASLQENGFNAH